VVHLSSVLTHLGPQLESLAVHSFGESFGSGFQWRVQGQYSLNGIDYADFASDVVSGVSAEGNAISAAYTTVTDFGLHLRFRIGCQATAGGTAGILSAVLSCKLRI
jgi:hypothetical protein